MSVKRIPKATAKRIPLYYQHVHFLYEAGKESVSSTELSEGLNIDSSTIRRDFSCFGELGKRGYGYQVRELHECFSRQLNQDALTSVALIGVGSLGGALVKYNFKNSNIRITAAFDVSNPLINTIFHEVPIYHMNELVTQLTSRQIDIVILTRSSRMNDKVMNELSSANIKGILNLTSTPIKLPKSICLYEVDFFTELQTFIYFHSCS